MADLTSTFCGVRAPNPFWLASAPPTNTGAQIERAFELGWGGAVWKTLGVPITNVSSRFGTMSVGHDRMVGFNNIELITDRPLDVNFREIEHCKTRFPKHALIISLMVETQAEWKAIIRRTIDSGADAIELNFGCPHGMCERGMGSAVGQEPTVIEEITRWAKEASSIPVLVKLTPNITDITEVGMAAKRGGADAVSLINTIQSVIGVDLDHFAPLPRVGSKGTNGGYCGPAVKPIALRMVGELARMKGFDLPISGIGGISTWRDAAEFISMGSTSVQVCTAVMHYGYRIIEDLCDGLSQYLDDHGMHNVEQLIGRAVPNFVHWGELDMNYKVVAKIDDQACIGCQMCVVACDDGAHQCIHLPKDGADAHNAKGTPLSRVPFVDVAECIGCNLCAAVCPVPDCISMIEPGGKAPFDSWNQRVKKLPVQSVIPLLSLSRDVK